jgi:translation initiation factor 2 subunit 1
MTQIDHLTEYSAIVLLLEYNHMKASLPFSELSARRLRETPQKILRVGKPEVLQVLRVDTEKGKEISKKILILGYIDLTRKNISPEEKQDCYDRYSSGKLLHSILATAVEIVGTVTIETAYRDLVFPLTSKYEMPLDAFKELVL